MTVAMCTWTLMKMSDDIAIAPTRLGGQRCGRASRFVDQSQHRLSYVVGHCHRRDIAMFVCANGDDHDAVRRDYRQNLSAETDRRVAARWEWRGVVVADRPPQISIVLEWAWQAGLDDGSGALRDPCSRDNLFTVRHPTLEVQLAEAREISHRKPDRIVRESWCGTQRVVDVGQPGVFKRIPISEFQRFGEKPVDRHE